MGILIKIFYENFYTYSIFDFVFIINRYCPIYYASVIYLFIFIVDEEILLQLIFNFSVKFHPICYNKM